MPAFALFLPVAVAVAATAIVHGANNVFKVALIGRHARRDIVLQFGIPAVIAALAGRKLGGRPEPSPPGLLFSAGLITGEALMGIMLAMPIAVSGIWPDLAADPFTIFVSPPLGGWPGLVMVMLVAWLLYRIAVGSKEKSTHPLY